MSLRLLPILMVPVLCAALRADEPNAAPAQEGAPAFREAVPPVKAASSLAAGAVDPYDPAAERTRFLSAAGVDNELDEKEFQANRGQADPFVRSFDRWEQITKYDKDKNGRIDWFEADAYRQALRRLVLGTFDRDRNGRLDEAEREAAEKALARGDIGRLGEAGTGGGRAGWPGDAGDVFGGGRGRRPGPGRDDPAEYTAPDQAELREKFDKDGDGKLSAEEWREAGAYVQSHRRQWELNTWDADGDGQLSDSERRAMWDDAGRRARQRYEESIKRYDTDGDGRLNEEERRAWEQDALRQWEQSNWERLKKYDADGDGQLSDEERQAYYRDVRRETEKVAWQYYKEYDTDGDGQLSDEERKAMNEKWRQRAEQARKEMMDKYDTDGDGQLSQDERRKMAEDYRRQWEEQQKEQIRKYDADGDGKLSNEERQEMYRDLRRQWQQGRQGTTDAPGGDRGRATGDVRSVGPIMVPTPRATVISTPGGAGAVVEVRGDPNAPGGTGGAVIIVGQ